MKLVTIKEVSTYLQVKVNTLYSWVNTGTIPFYKLNGLLRFDMGEIEAWVRETRKAACGANKPLTGPPPRPVDIDAIVKKAIAETRPKGYNPSNGKPGPSQGLRKEV